MTLLFSPGPPTCPVPGCTLPPGHRPPCVYGCGPLPEPDGRPWHEVDDLAGDDQVDAGAEFANRLAAALDLTRVAKQVKSEREARQLSQQDLAAMTGTKQPAISRLESGRTVPRLDMLRRVAVALELQLEVCLVKPTRRRGRG